MVAIVRNEDARLLRRLDDERPLGDADRYVVDGEVDELINLTGTSSMVRLMSSSGITLPLSPFPAQATMTGCLRPAM